MKFIYVSFTHCLKRILCLSKFVHKANAHGVEFSTCVVMAILRFWTLEPFWIEDVDPAYQAEVVSISTVVNV